MAITGNGTYVNQDLEQWASSRNTSYEIAVAIHELFKSDRKRSAVWEDCKKSEETNILKRAWELAGDDDELFWGTNTISKSNVSSAALGSIKSPKKAASSRENGKLGGRPAVKKYGYVVRGKHVIAQIEGMSRDAIKLVFTAEYHDPDLRLLFRPGSSLIYGPSVTLLEA